MHIKFYLKIDKIYAYYLDYNMIEFFKISLFTLGTW